MLFSKPKETHGVVDIRTEEEKEKAYLFKELVSAPAKVSLGQTTPDRWRIWGRRNQHTQDSCVYHARAKAAGILQEMSTGEFVEYSAADYNKRSNADMAPPYNWGSSPWESFEFWRKIGIGLEALEPSNDITKEKLAEIKQTEFEKKTAEISKLDGYYQIPAKNFDTIISTLHATGKPIPIGFYATYDEWNRDMPTILNPSLELSGAAVRHEVCATPNYGIWQNLEGFTIEDSWGSAGIAGTGVRFITREFFEKRNYIAGIVPTTFKSFEDLGVLPAKPKIKLARELDKGDTGPDVHELQMVMQYEGFFPANHTGSEYFGVLTEKAVKAYQCNHDIVCSGTPQTTGYGRVGPSTKAHINNRYKK